MDYEEYNKKLFDSFLEEKKRILLNPDRLQSRSIFGISDTSDKTYQYLLQCFEQRAIVWSESVTAGLCKHYLLEYYRELDGDMSSSDITIKKDGKTYKIIFKVGTFLNLEQIHRIINSMGDEPLFMVFLIDNNETNQIIIDSLQDEIDQISNKDVRVLSYPDYINFFFGVGEVERSNKNIEIIKKTAKEIIGQKLTEICTPEQKKEFKKNLQKTLVDFDYESVANEYNILINDLYLDDFDIISQNFIDLKRYSILLGDKEFAESFFTSEWLFQKYTGQNGLDNTCMITGYIKSIEQLLWDIVFIVGKGKRIGRNKVTIGKDYSIRTTLEDFCFFIKDRNNRDLCDENFDYNHRFTLMDALYKQIVGYKDNCRNGFFHKDNLSSEDVSMIRKKTYLLYFLILGILRLDSKTVSLLRGSESD